MRVNSMVHRIFNQLGYSSILSGSSSVASKLRGNNSRTKNTNKNYYYDNPSINEE